MPPDLGLSSHNLPFLEALWEAYEADPASIDPQWRAALAQLGNGASAPPSPRDGSAVADQLLQTRVEQLIEHYRLHGNLHAQTDPLERQRPADLPGFSAEDWGLGTEFLPRRFASGGLFARDPVPLQDILERLRRTYCRHVAVEYWHITDPVRRGWLQTRMEACENEVVPPPDEQRRLLRSLARVDAVDKFLHAKFLGAKRFSVAGAESSIALLETLIEESGDLGVNEWVLGMAHRGRLAVLMNVLGKSPAEIFSEFESGDPWANLGSGDVKYHKGSYRYHTTRTGKRMYLALAFNPSHLEAITPVISGRVRAKQDSLGDEGISRVLGVTMHGDAAVMGQGVYAETLNLSRLTGYSTGGTLRVVINNQVGFTTDPHESRSTIHCTAVADMLTVPIFHVNGDDPEAAAYVARLAIAYRQQFHTDVVIDLVCYRKFGHNEGDEPTFTQPQMYEIIAKRPSVRDLYQRRLIERGTVTAEDCHKMDEELRQEFESALAEVRRAGANKGKSPMHGVWESYVGGPEASVEDPETFVSSADVDAVRAAVTAVPAGFSPHPKVVRMTKEIDEMLRGAEPLNWAAAEYLAYGSLLRRGHDVRISGQDSIRGTFNHRHVGWTDHRTGARHLPLRTVEGATGRFDVFNSPLSEFAVLGFEFGYSLAAPQALVIWEAQFGDFANGAQVVIDQFISSSEDKWNRVSGLTMFLPHGYEGQGPEHSSARLERFLQLCAEDNIQVCTPTTPAQMFHMLRRQVLRRLRKPLVVMTPKSLLRLRPTFSPLPDFLSGGFRRLIDDDMDTATAAGVGRVLLCNGRIYWDLIAHRNSTGRRDVAILRVEQLYPFPSSAAAAALARYPSTALVGWIQDEPRNMGAWTFLRPLLEEHLGSRTLRYVGRPESASPATGSSDSHKLEQEMILEEAFNG